MWASRRKAGDLAAPYEIISMDLDGSDLEVHARPPAGRSFHRPILSPGPAKRLGWWETEVGGSHESPWSMFGASLWTDGVERLRPSGWLAHGHPEWIDDTSIIQAAWKWGDPDFRPWATSSTGAARVGSAGYDPSWHPTTGLCYVRKNPYRICWGGSNYGVLILAGQPFDPYVSPDGKRIVVLVMESASPARWRIDLIDIATRATRTLLAAQAGTINGSPRWVDDRTLLLSRLTPGEWDWRPWLLAADTGALTDLFGGPCRDIGSVEYPFPGRQG